MVTGRYRIGGMLIQMDAPENLTHPKNLALFRAVELEDAAHAACTYTVRLADETGTLIDHIRKRQTGRDIRREDLTVFETDTGECRLMNFKGADWYYAVSHQTGEHSCDIWFLRTAQPYLTLDTAFWAPFCLERLMMRERAIVLHCAYMERHGEAILFSAPSGTGKSTQADLWETHRGTRTINGDRSLLIQREGVWYACGWPICGSSQICINEAHPIKAIIMLEQAKQNSVRTLHGLEAVRQVLPQLMINGWNRMFQIEAMGILDELLQKVPIGMLECDISEQAVSCLETYLENSNNP